ncbi:hypothetical protein [Rhodobacter capsulatus]|uniref:hypothetical protein n=1 Tax=Rhodobacter capsulatus TaxID=1061 RepID=UPI00103F79AA|nr:hypothetical protein [Rhodobacter capsulatus]
MKLIMLTAGVAFAACTAAYSEEITDQQDQIILNNSEYFCSVEEFNSVFLNDRASWDSEVTSGIGAFKPISLTLRFSLIKEGETFTTTWQTVSEPNAEMLVNNILAVVNEGNGQETILFGGALGQGIVTGTILQAGISVPVRMAWTDLTGSSYDDAYLYCRRVGRF